MVTLQNGLLALVAVGFAAWLMWRLWRVERKEDELIRSQGRLLEKVEVLEQKLSTDALTGAMTRGPGMDRLIAEMGRTQRHNAKAGKKDIQFIGVAIIDLDHFKAKNDTYGHLGGDAILVQVVAAIIRHLRATDFIIRYGGEEFLLVFPEVTPDELLVIAERLRKLVEGLIVEYDGQQIRVTMSVGVTVTDGNERFSKVLERADGALYAAKGPKGDTTGRNRVKADFTVNGGTEATTTDVPLKG